MEWIGTATKLGDPIPMLQISQQFNPRSGVRIIGSKNIPKCLP